MSRPSWRGAQIGCGFFAPNQMHAWRSIPEVEIVALCDQNLSRARAMGSMFGVASVYEDAAMMLDREQLDFIDIVTTVASHRPLVELGAHREKAVICQKPFAETLLDADAMIDVCHTAGVPLIIHENFRWQRPFREIAERIGRGGIGEPRHLRLTFRHCYDIYRDQPYLARTKRLAVMDVGLHLFDLARFLIGDLQSIDCRTRRLNPAILGEDTFEASLWHESGAMTRIDCSFYSLSDHDSFPQTLAFIEGARGSLELTQGYELAERLSHGTTRANVEPEVPAWGAKPWHCIQDSIVNFQRHVVDVLGGRTAPQPSGAHNRDTLAIAFAAYESAEQNRRIDVAPRVRSAS